MIAERKKILEMLAQGKITADEADQLLEKIGSGSNQETKGAGGSSTSPKPKFLRIVVNSPDRDQVNVRVPLAFMSTGMKLLAVLPPRVSEKLAEKGIDLAALEDLKNGALLEAVQNLNVDVDAHDGKKVQIYCEP
ncbi:MAG TPA: hypothetical protein VFI95_09800 [Terriglobales bacterium]|nr:hypothetical protein [Terriglobales bacterium]